MENMEVLMVQGFYFLRIFEMLNNLLRWNGMIAEVLNNEADMAVADLSITTERLSAVEFSMPWMNLGISIIYIKPRAAPPSFFSFLEPFSNEVRGCSVDSGYYYFTALFNISRYGY